MQVRIQPPQLTPAVTVSTRQSKYERGKRSIIPGLCRENADRMTGCIVGTLVRGDLTEIYCYSAAILLRTEYWVVEREGQTKDRVTRTLFVQLQLTQVNSGLY